MNCAKVDDKTIFSTPQPFATSTEMRKRLRPKESDNLINLTKTEDSDESMGLISIKSDNIGPYIEDIQLKDSSKDIKNYAREQRELASKMLQRRESKVLGLPTRPPRLSDLSSGSHFALSDGGSTISESDLLGHNSSSTPRPSISGSTLDIAGTLSRMSLELKDPTMSLSTALNRMQEEYEKIQKSISIQSDMFKSSEEAEKLLLAGEASWRKEKELPAQKVDFSMNNFDSSEISSISAYFKQRTEDLSDIIPSKPGRSSEIRDTLQNFRKSSVMSLPSSISVGDITASSDGDLGYALSECDLDEVPVRSEHEEPNAPKESLSISRIAEILQKSDETPTKVLNYLLKHCPGGSKVNDKKQMDLAMPDVKITTPCNMMPSVCEKTDQDSGNFDPSTLTPNKENYDCINTPQQSSLGKMSGISKSLTSLRSTSSLSNLPGGKLPIETTHCELVWGCVKAGKSETKQFTLRNKSASKVQIQCSISSPVFRIMQDRAEDSSNCIKILLRAHETKSISVIFNPLSEGAAADEIVFSPCNMNLQQTKKQSIKLFGYGGSGSIEFKNKILKDSSGRHWLSLGNILGQSVVQESITVINRGSLPSFAFLDYISKDLAFSKISVHPRTLILEPFEERRVDISLKLNREDMKHLHNNFSNPAFEIGTVKIISGTEATRGRIKRLCKLVKDRNLEMDCLGERLMQDIQGEAIPIDVVKCRESITSLKTLLLGLTQKEVVLIVEKDLDSTLVPALNDDTSMFQSLYQDSTFTEESVKNSCKLEPALVILNPPSKCKDILFLTSDSDSTLSFNIEVPEGIKAHVLSGTLKPQSTVIIQLEIDGGAEVPKSSKVSVNVEGEIFSSTVKVRYI
ncbi:uncharacterized protein LOC123307770 [Coccinella septempunctata]|uniref:uncharacterized protein LOC123307770 n=1 Tax=Coccinella septempunctata TaxID=41139 RepID=UPI001D08664D|nr:uncharacterized protein LOC123307770 [Coccinella septempunctata]